MDIPTVTMTAQQMADLPTGTMSCTPPDGAKQDLDGIIRWKQRSVGCKSGFVLCEKPVEGHVQWSVIALVPGSSNNVISRNDGNQNEVKR
jgi:hypothetical protein